MTSTSCCFNLLSRPYTSYASNTISTRSPEYAWYSAIISTKRSLACPMSTSFNLFNSSHAPMILYPSITNITIVTHQLGAFFYKLHTKVNHRLLKHLMMRLYLSWGDLQSNRNFSSPVG